MRPRSFPHRPRPLAVTKHLPTDSTSTLPAYSSPQWPDPPPQSRPFDEPPDYLQSEEEADHCVPLRSPQPAATRRSRHRRGSHSVPTSPSVDDLLERSVVALELSTNALLQSMDTQSSLSALANDQILERSLDRQARMLDMRLKGSRNAHKAWMDDLDDVMKGVDVLLGDGADAGAGMSRSLPSGTPHMPSRRRHHHGIPKSRSDSAYLHLSTSELDVRDTLRPPRAVTQYVSVESTLGDAAESTADPNSIYLPSTTGLRSVAQIQGFSGAHLHPHDIPQSISSPGPESNNGFSTPAYTILSHVASHQSSHSPSCAATPASPSSPSVSDSTASRTIRRNSAGSLDSNFTFPTTLRRSRSVPRGWPSVPVESPSPLPPVRAMTPPMEEITPSSSSESCSSGHKVKAFLAMQSLRKILDASPDANGKRPAAQQRPSRPIFWPRTPAVAPSFGTSTATASVSRLFTRSSHHTSSSNHSRPKQSSLRHPASKPSTPTLPVEPGHLTPSSSMSSAPGTPRQVSFAELPDAYPGRSRRRGKEKDKGKGKVNKNNNRRDGAWWSGWVPGAGASGAGRNDEKIEDKAMRGWGRPSISSSTMDEWMV